MTPDESKLLQRACTSEGLTVQQADGTTLQGLHKQGLIYMSVPVGLKNYISIPPLEVCF